MKNVRVLFFLLMGITTGMPAIAKVDVVFTCNRGAQAPWSRIYNLTIPTTPVEVSGVIPPGGSDAIGSTVLTKGNDSNNIFSSTGYLDSVVTTKIRAALQPYLRLTYFSNPGNMVAYIYDNDSSGGRGIEVYSNDAEATRFDISGGRLIGSLRAGWPGAFVSGYNVEMLFLNNSGNIMLPLPEEWSLYDMELKAYILFRLSPLSSNEGKINDFAEDRITCNSRGTPVTFSVTQLLDFGEVPIGSSSIERKMDFIVTSPSFIPPATITFSSADTSTDGQGVKLNSGIVNFYKEATGAPVLMNTPMNVDALSIPFIARINARAATPGYAESGLIITLDML